MEKTRKLKQIYYYLLLSLAIFLVDQFTKVIIADMFYLGEAKFINFFFNIVRVHNYGAAFGFLHDASGWQRYFFTIIAVVVIIFILKMMFDTNNNKILLLSYALILAGAFGNVTDRIIYGFVIDFLDFHFNQYHWPAFNVADMAITIGISFYIFDIIKSN